MAKLLYGWRKTSYKQSNHLTIQQFNNLAIQQLINLTMNIIDIKNLHKIYNESEVKVHAVNGVDLCFEKGEFTAIVGPSGSGKTTLLNMLGGLDQPTEGSILVDGTDLGKLKSSQLIEFRMRNIGFVFQAYNLIPVLTAKENVEFIMHLQNVRSRSAKQGLWNY